MNREQHGGVGQQAEGQPLQKAYVPVIGDEYLQQQGSEHEKRRHEVSVASGHELSHFPHGGDVRGDVEGIRDQQQEHDRTDDDGRKCILDIGGKSTPCDSPD